jgi:ATP:corrinoid adenosyltransferase
MKMTFLVHFYYGNRLEAFQTGLGIIVRALGHSKKIKIYIINDCFSWVDEFEEKSDIHHQIISINETKNNFNEVKNELIQEEGAICLLANFDLLFDNFLEIKEFVTLIEEISKKNEIIITCEKKYDILEDLGDYVSSFELEKI